MKKVFFLSLSLFFLSACGGSKGDDQKATADSLQKALMPSLDGVWIMQEYVNKLDSTHSPHASWEVLEGAVLLLVNKQSAHGDSIMMGVNWNNHEGAPEYILLKNGIEKNSLESSLKNIAGDEKGKVDICVVPSASGKNNVVLKQYNDKNKLIRERIFVKVLEKQMDNDLSHGFDVLLNHKLLSGKYDVTDAEGKKQSAEFLEDGKTRGFNDNKFFNIRSDFMDAFSNLDIVEFYKDENTSTGYGFIAKGDSLDLYSIDSLKDKGEIAYGKKVYSMVKLK